MLWIYDLEQTVNFHSGVFKNVNTGEIKIFVLHELRNDLKEYLKFLKTEGLILIGYNNARFDYQLLHHILENHNKSKNLITDLYKRAQQVIKSEDRKTLIPEWEFKIPQIDLYLISHYDNAAKSTSLKWLEFYMRMKNVQDLPFDHTHHVTKEQIPKFIEYNINDVNATEKFFKLKIGKSYIFKSALDLRKTINEQYGFECTNHNDVKLGVEILLNEISKKTGIPSYNIRNTKTIRHQINLKDCILPQIKFKSKEFNSILKFLKKQIIEETKGVFSNTPLNKLGSLIKYCAKSELVHDKGEIKEKHLVDSHNRLSKLNVKYEGFQYDFGTGGIHGCISPGVYKSDENYIIYDIDVKSFYPNISIRNKIYPEHLGEEFCEVYEQIYNERAKIPKSNPRNGALKLALNGSYGKSNSKHSWLYDPKFTMSITINGQLQLCMLAERLVDQIDDLLMLQINTDGLTVKIKRSDVEKLNQICNSWEEETKYTLEYAEYKSMIIRDVNNYMAEYSTGGYKHKGLFEIDRLPHKNHSKRVVAIALHNYFFKDIPVEQTIMQHINGINFNDDFENHGIFDYCIAKKANKGWWYEEKYIENNEIKTNKHNGKILRYFVSNKGKHFVKTNGVTEQKVEKHPQKGRNYYITVFNYAEKMTFYNINFKFYISECNKWVNTINSNSLKLF